MIDRLRKRLRPREATLAELRARRDPRRWSFNRIVLASVGGGIAIAAITYLSIATNEVLLIAPLGSSCALIFVAPWTEVMQGQSDWWFVFTPVLAGAVIIVIVAFFYCRITRVYPYPARWF